MTNHFPSIPTDLSIKTVTYTLNFGQGTLDVIPALQFTGVSTFLFGALNSLGNQGGVQFTFTEAGTPGGFDQDTVESQLDGLATAVFQLMAALTGQTVSSLAANFSVSRNWSWVDSSGNTATYNDTMPYTPNTETLGVMAGTTETSAS